MPMKWDAEANQKLLMVGMLQFDTKIDAQAIANELSTPENPVTKRAVEQQWAKLKGMAKEGNFPGSGTSTPRDATAPNTRTTSKKPATPRKKKAAEITNENGEESSSPKKKPRKAAIKSERKMTDKDVEENSGDGKPSESIFGQGVVVDNDVAL